LAVDGASAAVVSGRQLTVMCDHVELTAAAAHSASTLLQQHGPAMTQAVVDACDNALRSTRLTQTVLLLFLPRDACNART